MSAVEYGGRTIGYTVKRSRRRVRTISVRVCLDGSVVVSAPYACSERAISDLVLKKAAWIVNKQDEFRSRSAALGASDLVSGVQLPYLGREYRLSIDAGSDDRVVLQECRIAQECWIRLSYSGENPPGRDAIRKALELWYRDQARVQLPGRVDRYTAAVGVAPSRVVVKDQKRRWGSCSVLGIINLNWRLVMAPIEVVDYVVVHELCHLKVMNHSASFWGLVATIFPDYKARRDWLKANGWRLQL